MELIIKQASTVNKAYTRISTTTIDDARNLFRLHNRFDASSLNPPSDFRPHCISKYNRRDHVYSLDDIIIINVKFHREPKGLTPRKNPVRCLLTKTSVYNDSNECITQLDIHANFIVQSPPMKLRSLETRRQYGGRSAEGGGATVTYVRTKYMARIPIQSFDI
jgi:hypothetical protein